MSNVIEFTSASPDILDASVLPLISWLMPWSHGSAPRSHLKRPPAHHYTYWLQTNLATAVA